MDRDLAELYGVDTAQLKRAVRRNIERFPPDFMFGLTKQQLEDWRCQFGTSNGTKMGLRHRPMVFTEQGVAMLSSHKVLKKKIEDMESKCDHQFKVVFEAMKRLLDAEERPKRKIDFEIKEPKPPYGKKAIA